MEICEQLCGVAETLAGCVGGVLSFWAACSNEAMNRATQTAYRRRWLGENTVIFTDRQGKALIRGPTSTCGNDRQNSCRDVPTESEILETQSQPKRTF